MLPVTLLRLGLYDTWEADKRNGAVVGLRMRILPLCSLCGASGPFHLPA